MRLHIASIALASALCLAAVVWTGCATDKEKVAPREAAAGKVAVDQDGAVHLPQMSLPFSSFASPEAKAGFLDFVAFYGDRFPKAASITEQRRMEYEHLQPTIKHVTDLYSVESVPRTIAGVYADVITPKEGIAPRNKNRVLINLHGGGFITGARVYGPLESIPVAGHGKIRVVAVDYRQGPENKFPAASEDVATVYKELLKTYKPKNIGIYGCSAGGVLTAEATAWIAKEHLPAPGAIGMFCGSAAGWSAGDSGTLGLPIEGVTPKPEYSAPPHPSISNAAYFSDADFNDPLVEPIRSTAVLSKFPPTLIVTSTRDVALSPAVYTHTQLVKLGVDAELHVWEGMLHGFFTYAPDLPETKEVIDVITRFFDKHLGVD